MVPTALLPLAMPSTAQVTSVLTEFGETVAVNCWVALVSKVTALGFRLTLTAGGGVFVALLVDPVGLLTVDDPDPQDHRNIASRGTNRGTGFMVRIGDPHVAHNRERRITKG
jgi:hypothetical protein